MNATNMQIQSISGWRAHIDDGRKYLKTATNGLSRPAVFNNELIFQLAAMAIEKLMVGLSQYHHRMPADHTLSGLAADLVSVCPVPLELVERINGIEVVDDMCALFPAHRISPGDPDIHEILAVGRDVEVFVDEHLSATPAKLSAAAVQIRSRP